MDRNPAKLAGRNPQPPPRPIRAYSYAELDAIAAECRALIEGAGVDIARRLGALEQEHDRASEAFGPLSGHGD